MNSNERPNRTLINEQDIDYSNTQMYSWLNNGIIPKANN